MEWLALALSNSSNSPMRWQSLVVSTRVASFSNPSQNAGSKSLRWMFEVTSMGCFIAGRFNHGLPRRSKQRRRGWTRMNTDFYLTLLCGQFMPQLLHVCVIDRE